MTIGILLEISINGPPVVVIILKTVLEYCFKFSNGTSDLAYQLPIPLIGHASSSFSSIREFR